MNIFTIFFIFTLWTITFADNSCTFHHPIRGTIDLTSVGLRDGHARFQNLSSNSSSYYTYSFNPCFSFTEDNCHNVAICQTTSDRFVSFPLALQNSSKWTIDSSNMPILTYHYGVKTVSISMICWSLDQHLFEILEENPINHYSMRLFSHCACWNGCETSSSTTRTTAKSSSSSSSPPITTTNVIYYSPCLYHDSRYGTIDLSSIGNATGVPTFRDLFTSTSNEYVWSYNPCYPFSELNCQNVSGCQIDRLRGVSYTIGLQEYAIWKNMDSTDSGIPSIVYPSTSINRRLTVELICDRAYSTAQLTILGERSPGEYTMQLITRCACWNECNQPKPDPQTWNFLIILATTCAGIFFLFCMIITCLFCTKPKKSYPMITSDEKTPFFIPVSRKN